jgi:adenylate cyclase
VTTLRDVDGAIELSRAALEADLGSGDIAVRGAATPGLVQALLRRRDWTDLHEAQAVATEPGFVVHDICLLRLRSARAG